MNGTKESEEYSDPSKTSRPNDPCSLVCFDVVFTELVETIYNSGKQHPEIDIAVEWFKKVNEYNVSFGKKNRGMAVVSSFLRINPCATEADLKLARILGWCIEWLQAFFLVADDIMDKGVLRRGKPCWYRLENVGMTAVNDAFFLESCVYVILKKYFRGKEYYSDLMDLFHEITMKTVTGQCLDLLSSPEEVNFEAFTEDRYYAIVKWKTGFYSFYCPVALAMIMSGIKDEQTFRAAENILIKMGVFFQIQDDFLDCYGDPKVLGKVGTDIEDNKCSWLIVQALKKATQDQRDTLKNNYGQKDQLKVKKVKDVFCDLEMESLYKEYEEESYQEILSDICKFDSSLPKEIFTDFVKKIYKRDK